MSIYKKVIDFVMMSKIFLQKDIKIYLSYKFNIFLRFFSIIIYVLFLFFFSKIVNFSNSISSETYFLYSLIGVCIADFCLSISSGASSQVFSSKQNGTFEELSIGIFSHIQIILMMFLYPIIFSFLRIFIYFIVITFYLYFFDKTMLFSMEEIFIIFVVILLSIISYIGIGLISVSFITVFNKGDPITYFNSIASFLIGGVFYPTNILPPFFEIISNAIPLSYGVEIMRTYSIEQYSNELDSISSCIFNLSLISVIYLLIGLISCKISLTYASKRGLLSNY